MTITLENYIEFAKLNVTAARYLAQKNQYSHAKLDQIFTIETLRQQQSRTIPIN